MSGCYDARESAYAHFSTAFEVRGADYKKQKTSKAIADDYLGHTECLDLGDLEGIRYEPTSMQLEGFVTRERILGRDYPDYVAPLIDRYEQRMMDCMKY